MTKEERAVRAAQRKAARDEAWRQQMADKDLMADVLRDVLKDNTVPSSQRLFALYCLNRVCGYSVIPYSLKFPNNDSSVDNGDATARLMAQFQEIKAAEDGI